MGWGAITFLALHPRLGQHGGLGVGWGGVGCDNVPCAASTSWSAWGGGGGVGCNNVPCAASTSWSGWGGGGGVGWGGVQ